jgi:hypothetical protein
MNTMNTTTAALDASNDTRLADARNDANVVAIASRRSYRRRDFGTGYGRSSGYALDKRYTTDWGQIRFRCA